MRIFLSVAITSSTVLQLSNWYCIHCKTLKAGLSSGEGKRLSLSHISSTTRPFSFMPPVGNSFPYWLNVMLPYFETQLIVFPSCIGKEVFANPRKLVFTIPDPDTQS